MKYILYREAFKYSEDREELSHKHSRETQDIIERNKSLVKECFYHLFKEFDCSCRLNTLNNSQDKSIIVEIYLNLDSYKKLDQLTELISDGVLKSQEELDAKYRIRFDALSTVYLTLEKTSVNYIVTYLSNFYDEYVERYPARLENSSIVIELL